jgi:hypothetical protein
LDKEIDMVMPRSSEGGDSGAQPKKKDESVAAAMSNSQTGQSAWTAPTQQQKDIQQQKSIGDTYANQVKNAQVDPAKTTAAYEQYKGAQSGTAAEYQAAMEKYLGENKASNDAAMAKSTAAEKAYSDRVAKQYGILDSAQNSLTQAMNDAKAASEAERAGATQFFESEVKGRFTSAMDKARQEYDAAKNKVNEQMASTDAYYQNNLKPEYAKMMEGGLSLRDASDPSNDVAKGVQNAYEGVITKNQQAADAMAAQIKKTSQADYGVLAALGNQARGSTAQPMTGAQQQLGQQASMNQASQAYQTAMQRVAAIEEQQRQSAASTRTSAVQAGMDQSWKNADAYRVNTAAAQDANLSNYNAQLAGTSQLGNLANLAAQTDYAGTSQLANARQNLQQGNMAAIQQGMSAAATGANGLGALSGQVGSLAGSEYGNAQQVAALQRAQAEDNLAKSMMVPGFQYQTQGGFNAGDYQNQLGNIDTTSRNATTMANIGQTNSSALLSMERADRQRADDIARQEKAIQAGIAAQQAQAQAQSDGSMWGTVGGLAGGVLGGVGGFFAGGPMGAMAGSSLGYGVGSQLGGVAGSGGSYNPNTAGQGIAAAANMYRTAQPAQPAQAGAVNSGVNPNTISPYLTGNFAQNNYGIGVAPVMNYGLNGVDPSLAYGQYSKYSMPMNQRSA